MQERAGFFNVDGEVRYSGVEATEFKKRYRGEVTCASPPVSPANRQTRPRATTTGPVSASARPSASPSRPRRRPSACPARRSRSSARARCACCSRCSASTTRSTPRSATPCVRRSLSSSDPPVHPRRLRRRAQARLHRRGDDHALVGRLVGQLVARPRRLDGARLRQVAAHPDRHQPHHDLRLALPGRRGHLGVRWRSHDRD